MNNVKTNYNNVPKISTKKQSKHKKENNSYTKINSTVKNNVHCSIKCTDNNIPKVPNKKQSKRKKERNSYPKIKLNKKFVNLLGGEPCATGCTSGDIGNLLKTFIDTGVDTIGGIVDFGETLWYMTVDMPNELVGAIESPSVNNPLTNII